MEIGIRGFRARRRSGPSLRAERAFVLGSNLRRSLKILLLAVLTSTLFLTFSRGAIYAFLVAMLVMTVWQIIRTKKWRVLSVWLVAGLAFLFTLNAQGIMAAVSPTNDTYATGVAKVLNHLTLGVVDVREEVVPVSDEVVEVSGEAETTEAVASEGVSVIWLDFC